MEDPDAVSPEVVQRFRDRFLKANGVTADMYTREALDWFRREVSKNMNPKAHQIFESRAYKKRSGEKKGLIGRLYLFEYDAKEAGDAETGVYDRFPMVFFFNQVKNQAGQTVLYGLNMHYLAPAVRAKVYASLLQLKTQKNMNARQKLRLEWQVIKAVSSHAAVERAVHAYRVDRLKTPLHEIAPRDWSIAVFLQLQKWIKISGYEPTQSSLRKTMVKKGSLKKKRK